MTATYFLDTNILVYAFAVDDLGKQRIAKQYVRNLVTDTADRISWQVLNEFCQVVLKKLTPQISVEKLEQVVNSIPESRIIPFTKTIVTKALRVHREAQFAFWDSMIVAAALIADCDYLVTEDLSHGRRIEHITIINPFLEES